MTEKEAFIRVSRVKAFIECLTACPHVIPPNIGAEAFVEEIAKGSHALSAILKEDIEKAPE